MWIALSVTCAFGNALWTALSKPVMEHVPPLRMMLIFRILIAAIVLVPFLWVREIPADPSFWILLSAIGVLNGARWVIILHGVRRDYFSTYGLYNTAPLLVLLLAPATLPERFGVTVWIGVFAIVGGGAIFYRTSRFSPHGLVGAVLTAIINILWKHGVNYVNPIAFFFLQQLAVAAVLGIAYAVRGETGEGSSSWLRDARRIAPLTLVSAVSGLLFTYAMALDTATRVSAVARVNLIFGFAFSYLMLRETWGWQWKAVGTVLIVAGTVAVALGQG